jgi:hypothetical protein
MPLNFDHSKNHSVNLISKDLQSNGILKFPKNNSQNSVDILISGKPNVSYISGLNSCLSSISGGYSGLYYTNDINGNCSYSYAVDSGSVAQVCNSIIFGSSGVAKLNYCHGETGVQLNSNGPRHSQIVHSMPSFNLNGDSQNTNFLSKATVFNNSGRYLICGTVDCDTIAYGNFDIIGKGFNETGHYGVFKVKTSLFRTSDSCICTGYFNLNTVVNCNLNPSFNISITGSNNASWGLSVCNASGMQWLTRASILEIAITGAAVVNTIATYWKCTASAQWFNLSNWFSDEYVTTALSYSTSSTDVIMSGNCAALTVLSNDLWVKPNSINTILITDPFGICFCSTATGYVLSGINIYGNATFGNNTTLI